MLLAFYEEANKRKGGGSYARYIINVTRDFCQQLNEEESRLVLAQGHKWPNAALGALYQAAAKSSTPKCSARSIALDAKLATIKGRFDPAAAGRHRRRARPQRRRQHRWPTCARSWTSRPSGGKPPCWAWLSSPAAKTGTYLVKSLPILEPAAAREVCAKLTEVDQSPEEPSRIARPSCSA